MCKVIPMLKQFMANLGQGFRRFMAGRYGTDRLNMTILITGVVISLIGAFIRLPVLNLLTTFVSYGLMFWAIFRSFSRNTYRRYEENRRFLQFFCTAIQQRYKRVCLYLYPKLLLFLSG